MNRSDFQDRADLRIAEAECLFRNGMFVGASYLAGYAVETGMKACIAKTINQYDFPPRNAQRDCCTHDLELLLKTAGLDRMLDDGRKVSPGLDRYWKTVKPWKEDCRYEPRGSKTRLIAADFILAITDNPDGVLTWIKRNW